MENSIKLQNNTLQSKDILHNGNIRIAVLLGQPSIARLKQQKGIAIVLSDVMILLQDYLDSMASTNIMPVSKIPLLVEGICQKYYDYRLEDFRLFFERCKLGQYGKTFNKIDGETIGTMLELYDKERMEAIESRHQKDKEIMNEPVKIKVKDKDDWYEKAMKVGDEIKAKQNKLTEKEKNKKEKIKEMMESHDDKKSFQRGKEIEAEIKRLRNG